METPALVLVPSSPLEPSDSPRLSSSKNNSPVSSDSSHTTPPSAYGVSVDDDSKRNSSESTIFSIYSMYSERRQTWRKSALANNSFPAVAIANDYGDGSREGGVDAVADEGRPSESLTDSFYRGRDTVSRQSSSGSGFFAGSAEGSSRHQSYAYSPSRSRPQSRPASRLRVGPLSDANQDDEPTELPYANGDTNPNDTTLVPSRLGASTIAADARTKANGSASLNAAVSWDNCVDLTDHDDGQPDPGMHHGSPALGRSYGPSRTSTAEPNEMWEKPSRPPRPSPPPEEMHRKSESASTAGHLELGLSRTGSLNGVDSMSSTHEGFVTAPQSIESMTAYNTPVQRFRDTNPSQSPSPSPPPFPRHSSISSTPPRNGLPPSPRPSSSRPSKPHAKQQSTSSSPPPVRRKSSSSRGSCVPVAGEEPEAFFVRNTYAQLDVTGVKGDGYEEGVERTRAKLGHDRRSVQMAVRNDAKGEIKGEIPEEEIAVLKNVDRYGFMVGPSSERVVLLPTSALLKPLHRISQSHTSGPPSPPLLSSTPQPPPVSKDRETKRILKWGRMLEAEQRDCGGNVSVWRVSPGKEKKLRARVFKGIPDAWRAAAWEVLIGRWVGKRKKQSLDAARLTDMLNDLRRDYRSSLDRPSSYDVQIDLDVPRTINGHVLFKTRYGLGQRSLFHTLHSFSLLCSECGYCQGMGPLAATLLCYYEPEKVYAFLVHFHDEYQMHDIFLPGFPGLHEAIYVQEKIIEKMLPMVYASLKKHMISTMSYAAKWYITLFANTVSFQTQLRLWDVFLLEGQDVFIIIAVGIIWAMKDHLTSSQASLETALSLLSSFFVPEDEDALLKWIDRALDDKKLRNDMTRWRANWRVLVSEKKEMDALIGY